MTPKNSEPRNQSSSDYKIKRQSTSAPTALQSPSPDVQIKTFGSGRGQLIRVRSLRSDVSMFLFRARTVLLHVDVL